LPDQRAHRRIDEKHRKAIGCEKTGKKPLRKNWHAKLAKSAKKSNTSKSLAAKSAKERENNPKSKTG
jgi:hypothetical protein